VSVFPLLLTCNDAMKLLFHGREDELLCDSESVRLGSVVPTSEDNHGLQLRDDSGFLPSPTTSIIGVEIFTIVPWCPGPPGVVIPLAATICARNFDSSVISKRHCAFCHPRRRNDLLAG